MNLFVIGDLLGVIGEILLAYTVVRVHHRILEDKKIDKKVLSSISHEQVLAGVAMILIFGGFVVRTL